MCVFIDYLEKRQKNGIKIEKRYGMMRVYAVDLQDYLRKYKQKKRDLFSIPLEGDEGRHTISRRWADPNLLVAFETGNYKYLGYLLTGDEVTFDLRSKPNSKEKIDVFCDLVVGSLRAPEHVISSWTVAGFATNSQAIA